MKPLVLLSLASPNIVGEAFVFGIFGFTQYIEYKLSESTKSCLLLWTSAVFTLVEVSGGVFEFLQF